MEDGDGGGFGTGASFKKAPKGRRLGGSCETNGLYIPGWWQ